MNGEYEIHIILVCYSFENFIDCLQFNNIYDNIIIDRSVLCRKSTHEVLLTPSVLGVPLRVPRNAFYHDLTCG